MRIYEFMRADRRRGMLRLLEGRGKKVQEIITGARQPRLKVGGE